MIYEILFLVVVILISLFGFLWSRKCLTLNDEPIIIKEDVKSKIKTQKQGNRIKVAKKETLQSKPKNVNKSDQKPSSNIKSISNKNQSTSKEVNEQPTSTVTERSRNDSIAEWTKVSKANKKMKKENKTENENSPSCDDNIKVLVKENLVKETPKVNDKPISSKGSIEGSSKLDPVKENVIQKVNEKPVEQGKNVKAKKYVPVEREVEIKEKPVETKPNVSTNDDNYQQKINDMMTELEKMKDSNKTTSQTNKDFETLKQKLKASQTNEEKLLEDVRKKGQAVSDLKNQFLIIQSELTKNIVANQSLTREKMSAETRIRSFEDQMVKMAEKCQHFDQIKLENEDLIKKLSETEQEYKTVQHECKELLKSQENEMNNQINSLQKDKQRIQEQLLAVQSDFISNSNKMQSVQQDLLTVKNSHAEAMNEKLRLQKLNSDMEQSIVLKQQELTDLGNKIKQYEEQIAHLTKQINDINGLNANLSQQISELQQQVDQLSNSQAKISDSEMGDLVEKLNTVTSECDETKAELKSCQVKIEKYENMCSMQTTQLTDLIMERDNLLATVDQYKSGLESTELVLSKLQMSVNEEESKWRESLMKSETEADKSKKELEIVYNDLMRIRNSRTDNNELNFAYHCVDKSLSSLIDEMEARMIHFEKCLETVVQERDNALSQIASQLNGVTNNHEGINNDQLHHDNECEMEKLKTDLNNQLEINKSLENRCNKFQSLIDIGKDALEAEKTRVQELQEELKSLQFSSSVSNDISSS